MEGGRKGGMDEWTKSSEAGGGRVGGREVGGMEGGRDCAENERGREWQGWVQKDGRDRKPTCAELDGSRCLLFVFSRARCCALASRLPEGGEAGRWWLDATHVSRWLKGNGWEH